MEEGQPEQQIKESNMAERERGIENVKGVAEMAAVTLVAAMAVIALIGMFVTRR